MGTPRVLHSYTPRNGADVLLVLSLTVSLAFADEPVGTDRSLGHDSDQAAAATKRVALVIGNDKYDNAPQLPGTTRDARAIAEALRDTGFQVTELEDVKARTFDRAIADFSKAAHGADVATFYYSGHGIQVDGQNYLVPVDAEIDGPEYVKAESVGLDEVLAAMDSAGTRLNIVILDACRNNPFAKSWVARSKAAPPAGLAPVNAYKGFYIAYATAPGDTARDGGDEVGPYASALASELVRPGSDLDAVFRNVGGKVVAETGGDQIPWTSSAYYEPFWFVPPPTANPDVSTGSVAQLPPPVPRRSSLVLAGTGSAAVLGSALSFLLVARPTYAGLLDEDTRADAIQAQQVNHAAIIGGYALGLAGAGLLAGAVIRGEW